MTRLERLVYTLFFAVVFFFAVATNAFDAACVALLLATFFGVALLLPERKKGE